MIRLKAFCILGTTCLTGLTLSSATFAGAIVTVEVPCSTASEPGLRLCKDVIERDVPATANMAAKPSMVTLLRDRVKEQIDGNPAKKIGGYYQNVDPDPQSASRVPNAGGPQGTPGTFFGPTVCNLVAGEFTADHHGKSCGNPTNIQVHGDLDIILGCVGPAARVSTTLNRRFTLGEGTLEDGYIRGGLIAATNCFHESVKNDLINKKAIIVSDASECLALARDVNLLNAEFKTKSDLLKKQLTKEQANIADIMNCGKSWDTSKGPRPDQGPLRQSAQLLCAAQQGIETMITQLAACEVFARAKLAYSNVTTDTAYIFDVIRRETGEPCGNFCKDQFPASTRACNPPSDDELTRCAKECYLGTHPRSRVPSIKDVLKKIFQDKWPSDGSNCKQSMLNKNSNTHFAGDFSLFILIGSLGGASGLNSRRRKKKTGSSLRLLTANLCFLGIAGMLSAGCSNTSPVSETTSPGACTQTGQDPLCPCPLTAGGPNCPKAVLGGGGAKSAMAGAAEAARTTSDALGAATALIGGDGTENLTGGTLAQGEAASAGDSKTTTAAAPAKPIDGSGNHGTGASSPHAGKSGGGMSGGGAATGMSLSDLKTGIATLTGTEPATAPSPTTDGTYQSGASAGADSTAGDSHRFRGDSGIESGANTEVGFTPEVSGESGQALGSEDPSDYFTRMGLDANIFKIVEKRYREKSMNWVTADLKGGAPGLK